jgi:hypothetical protein
VAAKTRCRISPGAVTTTCNRCSGLGSTCKWGSIADKCAARSALALQQSTIQIARLTGILALWTSAAGRQRGSSTFTDPALPVSRRTPDTDSSASETRADVEREPPNMFDGRSVGDDRMNLDKEIDG